MQAIETAWKQFFLQFTPYVFADNELIQDPRNILYPRITFSYSMGDYFTNTLTTFQVWDWGFNLGRLWDICNAIAATVPVESGTGLTISSGIYFEYVLSDGTMGRTDTAEEMNEVIRNNDVESWQEIREKIVGAIEIKRSTPFLTPRTSDEQLSRIMYGTLQARYLNII